jgi:hypothetical protein
MDKVTSYEIKEALSKKHRSEFFITECKNGSTWFGAHLRFDALAIYKSWVHPCIRAYEVKVSRSDFLRDVKYQTYMPYCHELYFVVPKGLIEKAEIETEIGLIYYNPETGGLKTQRKATHRSIEINADMLLYILINRIDSDRAPFALHKEDMFSAWLKGKESTVRLGAQIKGKLFKENADLRERLRHLERREEVTKELEEIYMVMEKHGISRWGGGWKVAERIDRALSSAYPPGLDGIQDKAERVVKDLAALRLRIGCIDQR